MASSRTHIITCCLVLILLQSCTKDGLNTPPSNPKTTTLQTGDIATFAGTGKYGFGGDGGSALSAVFSTPAGLSLDSLGNLYVVDNNNPVIRKINSAGIISSMAGQQSKFGDSGDGGISTSAELGWLTDVFSDKAGNVYVSDGASNVIRKITASTGTISTIAGTFLGGYNIADPSRYSGDGGPAKSAHLNIPIGLTVGKTGNVYIVDAGNSVIRKIDGSTGLITTIAGNPGDNNGLYGGDGNQALTVNLTNCYEVALDAAENIYVAHTDANSIRKIDVTTGILTTVAGLETTTKGYSGDGGPATLAQLNNPKGIAFDASGNIYIADTGNNVIRKITIATGIITTIAGSGPGSGYSGDGGPATSAKLSEPSRIAVDQSGMVYIADSGNNVIRVVKQ